MSVKTDVPAPAVSPSEVQRRLDKYREKGFRHQAMPHAVYQPPYIVCPWPGCAYQITAVDFQIGKNPDPTLYARVIAAWWQGPGIVGRCPGCGRLVRFTISEKQPVPEPVAADLTILPDDWYQQAYIVP